MLTMRPSSLRVFLVAPQMIRWGLERLAQTRHPSLEVVGGAADFSEALPEIERQMADVVVVAMDGGDLQELDDFCARSKAKVLLVSGSSDCSWLDKAVMAGVHGVVRTCDDPGLLPKAIEKVHDGELWIDRSATGRIFMEMARNRVAEGNDPAKSRIATLTIRERQTMIAVTRDAGAPGKVVADRLCISEHTLRNHLTSIYEKLGLTNRVDLQAFVMKHKVLDLL